MIERVGALSILRFVPRRLDVFAPSIGGGRTKPTTADEALASGAVAVLDGPMFSRCDSGLSGTDAQRYAASQCSRVDYLLIGTDAAVNSTYPSQGATFSVVGDEVVVREGASPVTGARAVVQGYPHIVSDSETLSNPARDTDRTWRAALALMNDGTLAFTIQQSSMHDFARALVAAGALEAVYTDGGGSGRLATSDGQVVGASENRRVGSWLVVRSESSSSGLAAATGVALLLGAAWLATRKS